MKTVKVDGRWHSRRVTKRLDTPEELWALLESQGKREWQYSFPALVAQIKRACAERLAGLSHGASPKRDSPADLASRILVTVERLERNPSDALLLAYTLGEQCTLLRVYEGVGVGEKKAGRKRAEQLKALRKQRDDKLLTEALKIRQINRHLSVSQIAEMLAERGLGGVAALKKRLPEILKRK